ncbi:MAG: hypothetical protein K2P88_01205 [Chitinophagaceae bacterium]|uniref:zinc dependent phospholipase C family protein n=1 Tax=unclassified Paraflavitalea TaxID=2798305 RepID=UPI003D33E64C|nr:hypothetical protein [Chitinophagaceae bacterium]
MRTYLFRALALACLIGFSSWGFLVHRTVNQLAVYELPNRMQPFFFKNMDYIVKQSVRPDQRRNDDPTEATKHFIDFEAYGDSAAWKMPMHWPDAIRQYQLDTLLKYGYVPYQVMHTYRQLIHAFRMQMKDSILFYAADLAHYIGDAHVPLHTSINYDGQLTNQKGLHALWETVVPEIELANYNLSSRHSARYLKHPEREIWTACRSAFVLLTDVFQQELEATKEFTEETKFRIQIRNGKEVKYYTSEFAKAYAQRLGTTINDQLIKSADLIADFWFTAWVNGGRPDLNGLLHTPLTIEQAQQLEDQERAFRKNELLKNGWLMAKEGGN